MEAGRSVRRELYVSKAQEELGSLAERGVITAGNAFSSVLFVKGELSEDEQAGARPLSGADGKALRAALSALGYAPEDWCALLSVTRDGSPIGPELFREAITALDPATLVACDEAAAQSVREAYAEQLSQLSDFDEALLTPGKVSRVLGMRVMNLGGFAAALSDAHQKQVMWARLKRLPPLGAPY